MSLTKEIPEKKVNFEFNKEFINVLSKKIMYIYELNKRNFRKKSEF